MRNNKVSTAAAIMFSITSHAAKASDLVTLIGNIGGIATAGQTVQSVNSGSMGPLDAAQVAAGGVYAYVNDPKAGQIALGSVSTARILTGQSGTAIDPAYDAVGRIVSVLGPNGPNNASLGTAVLGAADALGFYEPTRALDVIDAPAPELKHPALAPHY